MHFLYPSHPMKASVIEPMYDEECAAIQAAGFATSLCPDSVIQNGKPLKGIPCGSTVVYRGWMLDAAEYSRLNKAISNAGANPLTSTEANLAAHHCPKWYQLIAEFTPETRVFPLTCDLESELRSLGWKEFFIKDYVKSLKTSRGAILRDPSEVGTLVEAMKHFRGEIENGFCVRRIEPFIASTEKRYFVLNGKAFAPNDERVPRIVGSVASRIPSPFFSVDVIRREDGIERIVEIGDGQVSDLVGWTSAAFTAIWRDS
jgi:hypothetical protein